MPEAILGLSAYYHDSAAAILVDGEIIAAAHEERFTRPDAMQGAYLGRPNIFSHLSS